MTTRLRALWLVALMFVIFVMLTVGGILQTRAVEARDRERIEHVQQQQDEDMCRLLAALLPDTTPSDGATPGPTSRYGQAQRQAIADYRAHRC